jgi:hypothetical protein
MLMARHWSTQALFMAAALPALVSTFTMIVLRATLKTPTPASDIAPAGH